MLIQVAPGQSLQTVIDTLPADDQPVTIHLAPGVYEEKIALRRPRTCIEGESAETTRITWHDGAAEILPDGKKRGTFRTATLLINARDCALRNVTVENSAYPREQVGQALALYVDGDGKLDVVLNVTVNGEALGYLVLTSADEVICAYGCYYRAMIGLKEDGSFSFSSSAAESGVATFYKDENRDAQYNVLAESKLDENGNVVYFVNGEAADEDAFTAVINAQNEKADVTFVPATAENLALYLTIE